MRTLTMTPMFRTYRRNRTKAADMTRKRDVTQWLQPILESRQCPRCQGFLVGDLCYDIDDDQGQRWFSALRCVQCGDVLDPIIMRNRLVALERRRAEAKDCAGTGDELEEELPLLQVSA